MLRVHDEVEALTRLRFERTLQVTTHSSVIHEYYVRECNNPVHLTVDTTLANTTRMAIKAYVCVPLGVPNGKQGSMFTPVKVQVCYLVDVLSYRQRT